METLLLLLIVVFGAVVITLNQERKRQGRDFDEMLHTLSIDLADKTDEVISLYESNSIKNNRIEQLEKELSQTESERKIIEGQNQ